MSGLSDIVDRIRGGLVSRVPAMRPNYPPVAIEMDADEVVLVRLKRKRRGNPELEAHLSREMPADSKRTSMFRPTLGAADEVTAKVRALLETSGTKPGRASLVLPDNIAKISLVHLPDRPASRKQLDEIIRFKLRRAVPFRLEEATLSYQVLPGEGRGVDVLVILLRKFVIEQYETALANAGTRVGLVDVCTPNLLNLARDRIAQLGEGGGDVALFNFASGYFTLVILRQGRIIFYRCKSIVRPDDNGSVDAGRTLEREIQNSLAYHQEKLGGEGLRATLVRSVGFPLADVEARLDALGISNVEAVDPSRQIALPDGARLDPVVGQRIAPAVGAAAGRS
jgi:type IV pilus assembly protein PilM